MNTAAACRRRSAPQIRRDTARRRRTRFSIVEEGIAIAPKAALTLDIQNLLNDRYYVTLLNAQGNHYAPPRALGVGIRVRP